MPNPGFELHEIVPPAEELAQGGTTTSEMQQPNAAPSSEADETQLPTIAPVSVVDGTESAQQLQGAHYTIEKLQAEIERTTEWGAAGEYLRPDTSSAGCLRWWGPVQVV